MDAPTQNLLVPPDAPRIRLDIWLHRSLNGPSRTEIQSWIHSGRVTVNGGEFSPGTRVTPGMSIQVIPQVRAETSGLQAQDLPLEILYEDDAIVAVNKPAGQVVHPAPGHPQGTVLNAMLHRYPDLAQAGPPERPGVVHRLDADTSGVLLFARTTADLEAVQQQFKERSTEKTYLCVCRGIPHPVSQEIDLPIGRHPVHRQKRAVQGTGAREARSRFRMIRGLARGEAAELEVCIETGRTHQIRVHLDAIHHPILGDPLYGGRRTTLPAPWPKPPRLLLHAARLVFTHPRTNERLILEAPIPMDYSSTLLQYL